MATLQAAMSGASVASMALAGIFGDLVGVRAVFVLGALVVGLGGIAAAILYRGVTTEPAVDEESAADAEPAVDTEPLVAM